jgi:hypothetical protein
LDVRFITFSSPVEKGREGDSSIQVYNVSP